jgi:hypothetical protein
VIYQISADDYRRATINTEQGEHLLPLLRFYFQTGASNIFIGFDDYESFEVNKDNFKLIDPEARNNITMTGCDAYRKALLKRDMRVRIYDSYGRESDDPDDFLYCDGWTGVINRQLPMDPRTPDRISNMVFNVTFDEGKGMTNINGEYLIPII